MRILANDGLDKVAINHFFGNNYNLDTNHYESEEFIEKVRNVEVLIVRSATKVTKEIIDKIVGSDLKLIIRAGVGLDNIDVNYAISKGIKVKNTPNASSNSVAEMAMAHIFAVSRFLGDSNFTMKNGQWEKSKYKGVEIHGKTLGIIGLGRIGKILGEKAKAIGMKVVYHDNYIKNNPEFQFLEFEELIKNSDYISLHVPSQKQPLFGKKEFDLMKNTAFIINTARGKLIDESALLEALDNKLIAGTGLDVFAEEPTKNMELLTHYKVSASPHIGGSTAEAQEKIALEIISIVEEFGGNYDKAYAI